MLGMYYREVPPIIFALKLLGTALMLRFGKTMPELWLECWTRRGGGEERRLGMVTMKRNQTEFMRKIEPLNVNVKSSERKKYSAHAHHSDTAIIFDVYKYRKCHGRYNVLVPAPSLVCVCVCLSL